MVSVPLGVFPRPGSGLLRMAGTFKPMEILSRKAPKALESVLHLKTP